MIPASARRLVGPPSGLGSQGLLERGLQAAACILLAAIVVTSLVQFAAGLGGDRFAIRAVFRNVLLLATGLWAGRLALGSGGAAVAPPRAASRRLVVVLVNVLVCLLVLEVAVLWFARLLPTRVLWDERSVGATIAANRFAPGGPYFGFPMNVPAGRSTGPGTATGTGVGTGLRVRQSPAICSAAPALRMTPRARDDGGFCLGGDPRRQSQ